MSVTDGVKNIRQYLEEMLEQKDCLYLPKFLAKELIACVHDLEEGVKKLETEVDNDPAPVLIEESGNVVSFEKYRFRKSTTPKEIQF